MRTNITCSTVELQRSLSALCMTGILLAKEHVSTTGRGAVRKVCCRPLYDGKNDEGPEIAPEPRIWK